MINVSPITLTTVPVDTYFADTILVTETDELGNTYPANVISVISDHDPLTNVAISNTEFSNGNVYISGAFAFDLFPSTVIKYITRGGSDKIEVPVIANSFDSVPEDKQVFFYQAPTISFVDVVFTINTTNSSIQLTKTVEYNYDIGRIKLLEHI